MLAEQLDREIVAEIGVRLRRARLQRDLTQVDLARRASLSPTTVKRAEQGQDPRLSTLVRILRVLDRLDALDAFLPPPKVSPLQLMKTAGRPRQRARRRRRG